jgi:hypothetical protein
MSEPRWLRFDECSIPPNRKTKVWNIVSKEDGFILGSVFWYGPWRRFVFGPTMDHENGTIYEERCLRCVAEFVETQTRSHKTEIAAARAAKGEKT